jgi:hypothetical protein
MPRVRLCAPSAADIAAAPREFGALTRLDGFITGSVNSDVRDY